MKKSLLSTAILFLFAGFLASSQSYLTQVKPVDGKLWGYANEKGELIIPAQYAKSFKFSAEGLAVIYDSKDKQHYYINVKGEKLPTEISDFKLRSFFGFDVEGFKDGFALIKQKDKWGYLNTKGKLAIAAKYDDASDFNDGFASAKMGDKYFVLNTKGDEIAVAGTGIIDIKEFSEGLAPYRADNKKYGFVSSDGKIAIPAEYESVGYFKAGLAWAKTSDKKLGFINSKGEWVIKPQFETAKEFDKESGLARVKNGDSWGYVNKAGDIKYMKDANALGDFSEGLSYGEKDKKRGFYDNTLKWVIEPQFDAVRDFKNGFAAAKKGDKWGMIDKQGKWVMQPTYDGIKDMEKINKN